MTPLQHSVQPTRHNIQTLQVYLYYRIAVSGLLFAMYISGAAYSVLGKLEPQLFQWASIFYFSSCIMARLFFSAKSLSNSQKRIATLLVVDAAALLIMIHASGGINSGIGYLLVLSVAVASIFIRGQLSFAFAALVSLAVIGDTLILFNNDINLTKRLFSSGVLGSIIFTTATALYYLTEKIRQTSLNAEINERNVRNLQYIAQNIITRMQTGVVVLNDLREIELINESALNLLGLNKQNDYLYQPIKIAPNLADIYEQYDKSNDDNQSILYQLRPELELRVNFSKLDSDTLGKTILYIEDNRSIKQYAQQLKLASLGKLSASIAHEIRNPLGSMSHAAQLLSESPDLVKGDARMAEIIINNAGRVNDIIDNTLSISRRREPKPETVELVSWLEHYVTEYNSTHNSDVQLETTESSIQCKFDAGQIRQVLTNLVDNGLKHSRLKTGLPKLCIHAGYMDDDEKGFIEVIDYGDGISKDLIPRIYEPFFTNDEGGTGLGLYISKELCEINHATLHYCRVNDGKSCFRIDFSHHQRVK
ncbi:MAG: two-component system sensor histidine kinase PilS (NtrC family) [Flavobacteriales bacterium]|jgi:two-component system sensor histidine kinase PilS (NtrC family)